MTDNTVWAAASLTKASVYFANRVFDVARKRGVKITRNEAKLVAARIIDRTSDDTNFLAIVGHLEDIREKPVTVKSR